jgi:hypothetical protein
MTGEVAVERVGVARFEAVVQLLTDLPRELVHQLVGVDEVQRTHSFLRDACGLVEEC